MAGYLDAVLGGPWLAMLWFVCWDQRQLTWPLNCCSALEGYYRRTCQLGPRRTDYWQKSRDLRRSYSMVELVRCWQQPAVKPVMRVYWMRTGNLLRRVRKR